MGAPALAPSREPARRAPSRAPARRTPARRAPARRTTARKTAARRKPRPNGALASRSRGGLRSSAIVARVARQIVLLRGINLGSKRRVSMPKLREATVRICRLDIASCASSDRTARLAISFALPVSPEDNSRR